jgi:hypothetical protein
MDCLPYHSSLTVVAPACVGRRDFLKYCGVAGAALLGAGLLSGCESGQERQVEPTSGSFFADGTDFAD